MSNHTINHRCVPFNKTQNTKHFSLISNYFFTKIEFKSKKILKPTPD
jgi:hypothetical protein